jgi:hypothetical protein
MTAPAPAPTPPNLGAFTLAVSYSVNGQLAVNVLGGKIREENPFYTQADVDTWLRIWWEQVRQEMSSDVTLLGAQMRDLRAEGNTFDAALPAAAKTGAIAAPATVLNTSFLIRWKSAQGGRRGKGRTFVPGLPAASLSDDSRGVAATPAAAFQVTVNAYLNQMTADLGQAMLPAVVSRKFGTSAYITSGTLAGIVGTQRKRLR